MGLGGEEGGVVVVVGHLGQQPRHQGHRTFLEHAGRLAAGLTLDPAVRRVRGARVDSGQAQRHAVHPRPVTVAVRQVHRAVRHHGVQRLPGRYARREGGQLPAAAGDPFLVRVLAGVASDDLQVLRLGTGRAQVAVAELVTGEDRVGVRVDEAGKQGPAVQVDRLGGPQRPEGFSRANSGDAAAPDPHPGPGGQEPVPVEDAAVAEQDVFHDPELRHIDPNVHDHGFGGAVSGGACVWGARRRLVRLCGRRRTCARTPGRRAP